MQHFNLPRALRGAVRAEETPEQLMTQIRGALGDLRQRHDDNITAVREHVDNLQSSMEEMQRSISAGAVGGIGNIGQEVLPVEPEYTSAFASYMRGAEGEALLREANAIGERRMIQAAMSVGDNSAGGYLAPVEWDRRILAEQRVSSPFRRLATVQSVSVGGYTSLWSDNAVGSGWVGETAARPLTSTPGLAQVQFSAGEIYANASATQTLLDDSAISSERWLTGLISREFSRQEDIAFISGDGVNKPRGLLTFVDGGASDGFHPGGNITVVDGAITVEGLVDFMYGLGAAYRGQRSTWLMSSLTAAFISKLRDADGNLIWRPSLAAGQPDSLLGRPVEIDDTMPGPDAGSIAIAFGDFATAYTIVDRQGVRILRDPFTNKPFVNFYCTRRVGGSVADPNAIRLLRIPV